MKKACTISQRLDVLLLRSLGLAFTGSVDFAGDVLLVTRDLIWYRSFFLSVHQNWTVRKGGKKWEIFILSKKEKKILFQSRRPISSEVSGSKSA